MAKVTGQKRARRSKCDESGNAQSYENVPISNNSSILLNEKCLLEIFLWLDVEHLCVVSEVSKEFKRVADQAFSKRYEDFDFEIPKSYKKSLFRRALCKFGSLVKSINTTEIYPPDETLLDSIVKYCSGTLEKLFVRCMTIKCNKVTPLFSRLKLLQADSCEFEGDAKLLFAKCSELEHLYFDAAGDASFVVQKFPKLDTLEFGEIYPFTLWRVLELNPQIKTLNVQGFADDYVIGNIVRLSKNIERLIIKPGFMCKTARFQTAKEFLQLSTLKSLTDLSLDAGAETYSKLVTKLMNAFCKEKVPLEQLSLVNFSITAKDIKSIANVNTLKILHLGVIEVTSIDHLIPLAKQLPLLSELQFGFEDDAKISVAAIRNFIELATKLQCLGIHNIRHLKINQNDYDSLLEVARKREAEEKLTLFLSGCKSTTNCDIPNENQRILHIDFDSSKCECKECLAEDNSDEDSED